MKQMDFSKFDKVGARFEWSKINFNSSSKRSLIVTEAFDQI